MGFFLNVLFLSFGIASALIAVILLQPDAVYNFFKPRQPMEKVFPFQDHVWTASGKESSSKEISPFKVQLTEEALGDLKHRLKNTRFGPSMVDIKFTYGFPSDQLKKVVDYWLNKYDWRAQEAILNQYPHFITNIEGLDIHFVHIKPQSANKAVKTYPIGIFHGWPGSFFELYKLVPLLSKPRTISGLDSVAFEVIIPSIPGFAFSQAPEKPGLDSAGISRIYNKLMQRLGHPKYFIYGGDWGSAIARNLAIMYPDRVLGMDLTLYGGLPKFPFFIKTVLASIAPSLVINPAETYKLITNNFPTILQEFGFTHIQSTKPETVGAGLSDSPAGLAAYILEKFTFLTRPQFVNRFDGGLTDFFTMDELLTNVMIYWISNSIQSSVRIYKENCGYGFCGDGPERTRFPVTIPTILSDFRYEVAGINPPNDFVKPYYTKLIKISSHSEGGHFSALERPNELAEDIWSLLSFVLQNQI